MECDVIGIGVGVYVFTFIVVAIWAGVYKCSIDSSYSHEYRERRLASKHKRKMELLQAKKELVQAKHEANRVQYKEE